MGAMTDALQNIQPPTINETLINGSSDIVLNTIQNANTVTNGLWFVWSITALWIFLIYVFMDKEDTFLLDFPRALLVSSGFCLIVSVGAALSTLTTNIFPIFWFTSLVFLSGLMVMRRAEKNQ